MNKLRVIFYVLIFLNIVVVVSLPIYDIYCEKKLFNIINYIEKDIAIAKRMFFIEDKKNIVICPQEDNRGYVLFKDINSNNILDKEDSVINMRFFEKESENIAFVGSTSCFKIFCENNMKKIKKKIKWSVEYKNKFIKNFIFDSSDCTVNTFDS